MAFDPTVTLGNLLTLGSIAGVAIGSYYALKFRVDRLDDNMKSKIEVIDTKIEGLKEGTNDRHKDNRDAFAGIAQSIKDSQEASTILTKEISGLITRIAVVEAKLPKDPK